MVAGKGRIVGGSLLALCCALSTAVCAMEPEQYGASSAPSSTPALPNFLSDDVLPALQEAWRAREEAPEALPSEQGGGPLENAPAAVMSSTPVTADPDGASVRQRAEELSRRFGAEGAASPPAAAAPAPAPSVTIPPALAPEPPPAQANRDVAKPELPWRKKGAAEKVVTTGTVTPPEEVQPLDASVRTQSALTTEKLRLAAPLPPPDAMPPLPQRAPKVRSAHVTVPSTAPSTKPRATVVRAKPIRPSSAPQTPPDPKAALRGTVLTNELGAFGWNSQPK